MKELKTFCDRCQREIMCSDERILDELKADYPGKDICPDCDEQISLAAAVAHRAALDQRSPKEVLNTWIDRYQQPPW